MKVERVSYEVITPSAARGILEAIYWKPQIRWVVDRLTVLKPIRFTSLRRNEVGSRIPAEAVERARKGEVDALGLYVEDDRQQRASLLLRNVGYLIDAHFEIIAGEANGGKHLDMFTRRARSGQCFTRPVLGCREFAADFTLVEKAAESPVPDASLAGERDLGWMLHDIDFAHGKVPRFFRALMRDGVIEVPPLMRREVAA
jgi:CRISPR-associated protein Cas5d